MIKSIILSIFITSAAAFAPANHGHRVSSALFAESSEEAIQNALAASKKYGATSKEARYGFYMGDLFLVKVFLYSISFALTLSFTIFYLSSQSCMGYCRRD